MIDDLFGEAKKKGAELWGSIKGAGKKKLTDTVSKLNDSLPIIEEAGFVLSRMDLDIAILPRMFARFRQVETISDEKRKEIMERSKNDRFVNLLLSGLFTAVQVRDQVRIDSMDVEEIELEIGLTPSVKVIFRNKDM